MYTKHTHHLWVELWMCLDVQCSAAIKVNSKNSGSRRSYNGCL